MKIIKFWSSEILGMQDLYNLSIPVGKNNKVTGNLMSNPLTFNRPIKIHLRVNKQVSV